MDTFFCCCWSLFSIRNCLSMAVRTDTNCFSFPWWTLVFPSFFIKIYQKFAKQLHTGEIGKKSNKLTGKCSTHHSFAGQNKQQPISRLVNKNYILVKNEKSKCYKNILNGNTQIEFWHLLQNTRQCSCSHFTTYTTPSFLFLVLFIIIAASFQFLNTMYWF